MQLWKQGRKDSSFTFDLATMHFAVCMLQSSSLQLFRTASYSRQKTSWIPPTCEWSTEMDVSSPKCCYHSIQGEVVHCCTINPAISEYYFKNKYSPLPLSSFITIYLIYCHFTVWSWRDRWNNQCLSKRGTDTVS